MATAYALIFAFLLRFSLASLIPEEAFTRLNPDAGLNVVSITILVTYGFCNNFIF